MKTLHITDYLPPPSAHLVTLPDPTPGDRDIVVQVAAAAFNPLDAKLSQGVMQAFFPLTFPYIPGTDFAGEVIAIGRSVKNFAVGDAVFGRTDPVAGGALAEKVCVDQSQIARRPSGLSGATAACLPTPAGVAQQALNTLNAGPNAPLLVTGTGAVARAAILLAHRQNPGAVFVLGNGLDRVANLGATLLSPTDPGLGDIMAKTAHVLDTTGGHLQAVVLEHVKPGTHIATVAVPIDETTATGKAIKTAFVFLQTDAAILADLINLSRTTPLAVPNFTIFDLADSVSVFNNFVNGTLKGKPVMVASPS